MRKMIAMLCLFLCVLGTVTHVGAITITQGNSVTWEFDIDSGYVGSQFESVSYDVFFAFPGGEFDVGEQMEVEWFDDLGSSPIFSVVWTQDSFPATSSYAKADFPAVWTADQDIFLTLTMLIGEVDADPAPELNGFYWADRNDGYFETMNLEGQLPGTSVPDASIILLLGSSLMGLAVFSRKFKKTG